MYKFRNQKIADRMDVILSKTIVGFSKYANKNLKIVKLPNRRGDMIKVISNNSKLKKFIKWKPKFNNLNKIVKSCIIWERKIN